MDGGKLIYQCTQCGKTKKFKKQNLRDYIYADIYCTCCEKITSHIECGLDILSYYANYDPMMDERFYSYNTK